MRKTHRVWVVMLLSMGMVGGLGFLLASSSHPAGAQGSILAARVHGVDVTAFPTVTVFFQLIDLAGGVPWDQRVQKISVLEDGQVISPEDQILEPVIPGVDIVILLDASQSLVDPRSRGYTGAPRLEEARTLVEQVARSKSGESRIAVIAPVEDRIVFIGPMGKEGSPLNANGQGIANALREMEFPPRPKGKEATPLFDLLSRALEVLIQRPGATGRPGMVIVLSDGIDFLSDQQVTDVTRRAMDHRIVVHAIQVGPAQGRGSERAMENLRRIAGQTGGQVLIYGKDDLKPFYDSLPKWAKVWALHYRSRVRQGGAHRIGLRLEAGGQTLQVEADYAIHLSPPVVELEWEGQAQGLGGPDTPIRVSEMPSLPLKIRIRWNDQRSTYGALIRQVRVGENVVHFERTSEPRREGNAYIVEGIVDLSQAPDGVYSLKVDVEDNLGLSSTGEGPLIQHRVLPPAPPGRGILDVLPLVSCLIAVAALMVAAIAIARVPRLREAAISVTQPVVQRIKEVTEPFFPSGAARGSEPARAWLVVVEGEAERRIIPIRSNHVRLGRDETLVNIVFNDRSVSRLHCRIEEVEEGVFWIYDEGSTSGTYVNYEQVPINGARLQDGDLINLGRVQLHFRLRLDQQEIRPEAPHPSIPPSPPPHEGMTDVTRPFPGDDKTRVFREPEPGPE